MVWVGRGSCFYLIYRKNSFYRNYFQQWPTEDNNIQPSIISNKYISLYLISICNSFWSQVMQNKLYPRLVASSAMFGSIMPCANVRQIVVVCSSEPWATPAKQFLAISLSSLLLTLPDYDALSVVLQNMNKMLTRGQESQKSGKYRYPFTPCFFHLKNSRFSGPIFKLRAWWAH